MEVYEIYKEVLKFESIWLQKITNNYLTKRVKCETLQEIDMLHKKGYNASYEELVHACYRLKNQIPDDQSLVLKIVEEFS